MAKSLTARASEVEALFALLLEAHNLPEPMREYRFELASVDSSGLPGLKAVIVVRLAQKGCVSGCESKNAQLVGVQ